MKVYDLIIYPPKIKWPKSVIGIFIVEVLKNVTANNNFFNFQD